MEQAASWGGGGMICIMDILKMNLKLKIKVLERQLQSPDLKPKEILWEELIKCVEAGRLSNQTRLHQFFQEERARIQETFWGNK